MPDFRLDQAVSDQRIEQFAAHFQPVPFEHAQVELQIVTGFLNALGLECGPELLQNAHRFLGVRRQRNVVTRVWRQRKRQAQRLRLFGVAAAPHDMETKRVFAQQSRCQLTPLGR